MTPYELEAWAFSLDMEERADAFLVVSDAFEAAGDIKGAETRRSWAEKTHVSIPIKNPPSELIGYFYSIENLRLHLTSNGQYVNEPRWVGWSRDDRHLRDVLGGVCPDNAWYTRKGHWNRRKVLQKMSLEELVRWNQNRT